MAVSGTKWLAKLVRLTLALEGRWKSHSDLRAAVEAAERAGLVASGERGLLNAVGALLAQAGPELTGLTSDAAGDVRDRLAAVEAIIDDVRWEVSGDAAAQLNDRVTKLAEQTAAQQAQANHYRNQIREWQKRIEDLGTAVTNADKAYAAVSGEKRIFVKMDALVKGADRAFAEGNYPAVGEALNKLGADDSSNPETLVGKIRDKLGQARELARQADLLLIRSDLSSNRYQYTLLLRTPREPGTPGIDIQDESTMVMEDHEFFKDAMKEITVQINEGLVRSFRPCTAAAAEANTEEPITPPASPAPDGAIVGAPPVAQPPPAVGAGPVEGSLPANGSPGPLSPGNGAPAGAAAPTEDSLRLRLVSAPTAQVRRPASELVQDIGDLMYRLVVPETMQRFLTETKSSLTIRTNDVELPWELMRIQTDKGPEFLCLERPVARMPTGRAFPRRETKIDRTGKSLRFLLIYSDPDKDSPLSAAGREVQQIKDALSDQVAGIDTLMPQEITGKKLNRILLDGDYDVIHYAGHAAFDDEKPDLSGLLLWQKEVFFAQKVRRLLEGRPLVFVNACESGRTANEEKPQQLERSLQRPAEGIISSFIYGGAASCIGSVWPVYDQSAAEFAITFYRLVLEGYMVGEALRQARLESKSKYPAQITWASFVLYGDPTARLAR